ncbi:MAG: tetratricopeptide repeat protein, partial [Sphingobacteriales bacterium]
VLSSCKGMKDSKLAAFYHNVTAKFNGYFNGKEKLLDIEARLFETHPDNYNTILDVFAVGDEQSAKGVAGDLDIVIKKASRVILKHPTSNWIDDSYFLIAKANYYKRDYFAALESFEYLQQRYPNSKPGQEAPLWIIRCHLKMEKYNEAQANISALNLNKKVKPEIKQKLYLVESEYFIKTEQYDRAAERLELALKYVKGKKYKARYYFILAQLYQKIGNNQKATDYYKAVIKKNPVYELAFQAKIGLADVSSNQKEVENYLKRLTRDEKNISYYDQIYYVLAKSELKYNNKDKAIDYLKQSVAASQQNRNQKALSYLMLADVYFSLPNYPNSKAYYDSAANFIDKSYPGYERFKSRQETLSQLIGNLIIIQREDSLQKLSVMSSDQLKTHVAKIIANEQLQATQNQANMDNSANIISNNPPLNNTFPGNNLNQVKSVSGVNFSDPTWLARGSADFLKRWGRRPLEDNWRRKDKPVANVQNPNDPLDPIITNTVKQDTGKFTSPKLDNNTYLTEIPADQQRYYQDIPFTATQKNISNNKLQEAMFAVGNIYYASLKEPAKAAFYYEELIRRFPNTKNLLPARYNLYRIYSELKETEKANAQKEYILTNFPGTDYAQLIQNPDQLRDQFAQRNKNQALETLYSETYEAYSKNQCGKVHQNVNESERFQKNYLKAKFEYLDIICQYRNDSSGRLIDSLKSFTRRFPGDEVTKQAVGLIEYLERKKKEKSAVIKPLPKDTSAISKPKTAYKFDDGLPHYYIFVYPASADENLVKTNYSNLNTSKYAAQKLEIMTSLLDSANQVLVVKNFVNFRNAFTYMDDLQRDVAFYPAMKIKNYTAYLISDENYRMLMRTKDLAGYAEWYKSYY